MRSRIVPTLAALAIAGLTFALGQWQAGRASFKDAQYAQAIAANREPPAQIGAAIVEPAQIDHRRVVVVGEFLPQATIYLDNRLHDGAPGFHVLTPVRLEGGMAVVVNRGWMPVNPAGREQIVPPSTPAGTVRIEGTAAMQVSSYIALRGAAAGKLGGIWPNFSFDSFARESSLNLQPIVVQQTSDTDDGLLRDWPTPGSGSEKHIAYAIQWYALSALTIGLWIWFGVLGRGRKQEEETQHASESAG